MCVWVSRYVFVFHPGASMNMYLAWCWDYATNTLLLLVLLPPCRKNRIKKKGKRYNNYQKNISSNRSIVPFILFYFFFFEWSLPVVVVTTIFNMRFSLYCCVSPVRVYVDMRSVVARHKVGPLRIVFVVVVFFLFLSYRRNERLCCCWERNAVDSKTIRRRFTTRPTL